MHDRNRPLSPAIHSLRRWASASLLLCVLMASRALPAPAPAAPSSPWSSVGGRSLYRITPARGQGPGPLLSLGLDVAGTGPGGSLDVILSPVEVERVRAAGFIPVPLDLTPRGLHAAAESPLLKPGLGAYHTNDEANAEMQSYAAAYPSIAVLRTIGTSIEGRPIQAIKISDNASTEEAEPEVLVVGCHHARELMSVEIPLYLMRRLLDGYGADPVLTQLVNGRQIWIVPIVNPDGHAYVEGNATGQSDGWWRKNRRDNGDGTYGVDLNRNYGYQWGFNNVGSSPTPASEVYRGTGPFSEPETAGLRDLMDAHAFTISASFHSYGAQFLWPWGFEAADTPDQGLFRAFGDSVSTQNGYLAGNAASGAIYLTNGDMDDWVYGETGLKPRALGFTFEVNDASQGGFDPPEALIGPTCDLNWGPILTLLRFGDAPRRILPPARPSEPGVALVGDGPALIWSYAVPDPANPPVRHELRQIASVEVGTDDAEAGPLDWETENFVWSAARFSDGAHSYYSGAADLLTSVLAARAMIQVPQGGDSLRVQAFWDLQDMTDFWYAEASGDGGATWTPLPGDRTTSSNPNGTNLGNGVTGSSGGFLPCAFSLDPYAGGQVLVRFRCITDGSVYGEGLYLDDIAPSTHESGVTIVDTGSAEFVYPLDPPPTDTTWFQVRAVDGEGQTGRFSDRVRVDPNLTAVEAAPVPGTASLEILGPRPFQPGGALRFRIPAGTTGPFELDAFDIHGRRVRRLAGGVADGRGGIRVLRWDGADDRGVPVGSGVYLLRLRSAGGWIAAKVTLLR